ncbi:hypothetical protein Ddc_21166 [Ditylenchus destructor]|nr:hypothetical protein Ddc_21166 [Ditylenchus destructor]
MASSLTPSSVAMQMVARELSTLCCRHVHRYIQRLAVGTQHGKEGTHGQTVERQVVQELDEGFLQLVEVPVVGRHVVFVDIGDHGDQRLQVQEARVTFVGFGDQVTAGAQLCIGHRAANTEAIRLVWWFCRGYGDGNAVAIAHQLGQHLGAWHHGNATFKGSGHFRVGGVHGAGHHQHMGLGGVLGAVAMKIVHQSNTSAMPHMPTPPMPTKWIRRMRRISGCACFLILNHGPPPGRYPPQCGLRQVWPGGLRARHAIESFRFIKNPGQACGQIGGARRSLRQQERERPPRAQKFGVAGLVIVDRVGQRHQQGRQTAAASSLTVSAPERQTTGRPSHSMGHVFDEGLYVRLDTGFAITRGGDFTVVLAGLMEDLRAQFHRELRQCFRQQFVHGSEPRLPPMTSRCTCAPPVLHGRCP